MSDTRCTGGGTGCLTFLASVGAFLFCIFIGLYITATHRYEPFRVAACRAAGGDGRFEMRGGALFPDELWCARGDGSLFPVLDPQGIKDTTPLPPLPPGPGLQWNESDPCNPPTLVEACGLR